MVPIVSADQRSFQEHFFEMIEVLHVLVAEDGIVVEEGDEAVFGVSADVNDFATLRKQVRRQHAQRQMTFYDPEKNGRVKMIESRMIEKMIKNKVTNEKNYLHSYKMCSFSFFRKFQFFICNTKKLPKVKK